MMIEKKIRDEGIKMVCQKLEDAHPRCELLFLVVSGSHAWGLERADSDIDLRGIYQDSTKNVLKLHSGSDTVEFTEGNYDVQLYEVKKFLNLLCKHNGNMVNLLLLPTPWRSVAYVSWSVLATKFLTRKLRFYYRGYAESQRKRAMSQRGGKALIYTYREMFSGLYTMHYGMMEHDFMKLWREAQSRGWYGKGLLDMYFPDPKQGVSDEGWHQFYSEWAELCIKLDIEAEKSPLPETFDGIDICNQLLLSLRLAQLDKEKFYEHTTRD